MGRGASGPWGPKVEARSGTQQISITTGGSRSQINACPRSSGRVVQGRVGFGKTALSKEHTGLGSGAGWGGTEGESRGRSAGRALCALSSTPLRTMATQSQSQTAWCVRGQ